jgi:hypothetical protein
MTMSEKKPKPRIEHEGDLEADDVGMGLPASYYEPVEGPRALLISRTSGDRPAPHTRASVGAKDPQELISARLDDIETRLDNVLERIADVGELVMVIDTTLTSLQGLMTSIHQRLRANGSDQRPWPETE